MARGRLVAGSSGQLKWGGWLEAFGRSRKDYAREMSTQTLTSELATGRSARTSSALTQPALPPSRLMKLTSLA